jgi:hypothetical protein
MICAAYWIVLVGEIKVNVTGEQYGTYTGERNKDGVWEIITNEGCGLDLFSPG